MSASRRVSHDEPRDGGADGGGAGARALEAASRSVAWLLRTSRRTLVEAHATSHIESAELTFTQAETMLAGGKVEVRDDDARELIGTKRLATRVATGSRHESRQRRGR